VFPTSELNQSKVNLKQLAEHVRLTPGTVSAVLNNASYSKSIPQATRDRIFAAAEELNYRPNFFARSLRAKGGSRLISVVATDLRDARSMAVIADLEEYLHERGYLLIASSHRGKSTKDRAAALASRGVEGLIVINSDESHYGTLPLIAIRVSESACFQTRFGSGILSAAASADWSGSIEYVGRVAAATLLKHIASVNAGFPGPSRQTAEHDPTAVTIYGSASSNRTSTISGIVSHPLSASSSQD
jgi:hypothetical protein